MHFCLIFLARSMTKTSLTAVKRPFQLFKNPLFQCGQRQAGAERKYLISHGMLFDPTRQLNPSFCQCVSGTKILKNPNHRDRLSSFVGCNERYNTQMFIRFIFDDFLLLWTRASLMPVHALGMAKRG